MFNHYADISSRECYEHYRKNRKRTAKGINNYPLFKYAVEGLFQLMAREFVKSKHGMCIRDLGYFGMLRTPKKFKVKNVQTSSILKKYSKRYLYRPVWFPDVMYEGWHMKGTFTENVYRKIRASSLEYKIHKNLCDGFITLEDFESKKTVTAFNYKKEDRK